MLVALSAAMAGRSSEGTASGTPVLTIMPYQTATFVADPEAARQLSDLAEFSTRLLLWTDTPRIPVTMAGSLLKTALLPFYHQWRGTRPAVPPMAGAVLTDRISSGYGSLESPRIIRITVASELFVGAVIPADSAGNNPLTVPFIVNNTRSNPVRLTLSNRGTGETAELQVHSLELKAGQTSGFFLDLGAGQGARAEILVAMVDEQTKEIEVPIRHHEAGVLRVTIVDEAGESTPARVYLTGADRRAHAPQGHMQRIVMGGQGQPYPGDCYFHTDGSFAVDLPAGTATVEVVKGFEYVPFRTSLTIAPGDVNRLEVKLVRKANLAKAGWYSGDVHVHANLFAQRDIAPRDVLLAAKAEDLNVVNVLPCNDPRTTIITDGQYFTGGPDPVSEPNFIVYFNEEMRNDLYGHVGFLNLKTFVEPAYFGWPQSPFPYDYPGNYPQAERAKAQGGVVTYVHPGLPSEFPVDIALGLADTIDAMSQNDEEITTAYWYRLLNCGFRCPISAGTDSFLNIPYHLIPGAGRVYVQTGGELTYAAWIDGYKRGRSFATNAPLLDFEVNGREAGDEIRAESGPLQIEIKGGAESIVPMSAIEIVVNGHPVRRVEAGQDPLSIRVEERLEIEESSWIALRVRGPGHRLVPNDREVYAHTSPVYVSIDDRPVASKEDAVFFVDQIDALIEKMNRQGEFANAAQKHEIIRKFRDGQEVYRKIIARALK